MCSWIFTVLSVLYFPSTGWQACYSRLYASAHFNRAGPCRTKVLSASSCIFHPPRLLFHLLLHHPVLIIAFSFFFPLPIRYLVMFNPVERERLCAVTVLVNTVRVRVLTEDGQTLPVQLSAQWSSASQMSAEVFEVRHWLHLDAGFCIAILAYQ